jgi:transposase InsO family protein
MKPIRRSSTRESISNIKGILLEKLKRWETEYNEKRPHLALQGKLLASACAS